MEDKKQWEYEPDKVTFEYEGLKCEVIRCKGIGHLCGYVTLPEWHPWANLTTCDLIDVDVHGGITFAQQTDDGYVIGFDCGHAGDITPSIYERFWQESDHDQTYRDIGYVIRETVKLAKQAINAYRTDASGNRHRTRSSEAARTQ